MGGELPILHVARGGQEGEGKATAKSFPKRGGGMEGEEEGNKLVGERGTKKMCLTFPSFSRGRPWEFFTRPQKVFARPPTYVPA